MKEKARGYIASGEYNGYRTPQHIQNQIIKLYCDANNLQFILSRAEYWMNGSTKCQLWASLREGFKHIVFFSIWQLPAEQNDRQEVYEYCLKNKINLHFATERILVECTKKHIEDLEILIRTQFLINDSLNSYENIEILLGLL